MHSGSTVTGISLGVLIGLLSSVVDVLSLLGLDQVIKKGLTFKDGIKFTGEIMAIPVFWFGGPWVDRWSRN